MAQKQQEPSELYALSAVLLDGDTGRVLFQKEGTTQRPNASTTKILTCILALEQGNLKDMVQVSAYAASMPNVQLHIQEGEWYQLKDLLYSLMLESHNDVAVAIAEHIGGSVEEFAVMMNEKAESLGCHKSNFITPNGLDEEKNGKFHGTTAEDLANIMSYCIWKSTARKAFLEITRQAQYSFTNYIKSEDGSFYGGNRSFTCVNHNGYLSQNKECVSGKTGFTGNAGYCYVCGIESQGRHFSIALLGCGWPNHREYKWKDCEKLYQYAAKTYHMKSWEPKEYSLEQIQLLQGANPDYYFGENCFLQPQIKSKKDNILLGDHETIQIVTRYPRKMIAERPGKKRVGHVTLKVGNQQICKEDIVVTSPYRNRTISWYFCGIFRLWAGQETGNHREIIL